MTKNLSNHKPCFNGHWNTSGSMIIETLVVQWFWIFHEFFFLFFFLFFSKNRKLQIQITKNPGHLCQDFEFAALCWSLSFKQALSSADWSWKDGAETAHVGKQNQQTRSIKNKSDPKRRERTNSFGLKLWSSKRVGDRRKFPNRLLMKNVVKLRSDLWKR